jgi:hypothetical protein
MDLSIDCDVFCGAVLSEYFDALACMVLLLRIIFVSARGISNVQAKRVSQPEAVRPTSEASLRILTAVRFFPCLLRGNG